MEFKITKEFIIEAHGDACSDWKKRIESEFPDLFKKKLEVGRWYKVIDKEGRLYLFDHQDNSKSYGFFRNEWASPSANWNTSSGFDSTPMPATREEVEAALIAEAKKRGYKKGSRVIGLYPSGKPHAQTEFIINDSDFVYGANEQTLLCNNGMYRLFINGKWAEILPTEKTVITREKALKILAKKLKVSPEDIEIE